MIRQVKYGIGCYLQEQRSSAKVSRGRSGDSLHQFNNVAVDRLLWEGQRKV